jgi:hypothetical protein
MLNIFMISRRKIIQLSGLSVIRAGSSHSNDEHNADDKIIHCFIGESDGPLLVGMLLTEMPDEHRANIGAIRSALSYRRVLRYKSTDHFKVAFGERLIDYFLKQREMRFFGLRTIRFREWPDDVQERHQIYFGIYRHLLERGKLGKTPRVIIRTQDRSKTGRDQFFHEFLQKELGVSEIRRENIKTEDLTQLVEFLTGLMRDERTVGQAHAKLSLATYLRKSLDVPEIDEKVLRDHPKFNVRNLRV